MSNFGSRIIINYDSRNKNVSDKHTVVKTILGIFYTNMLVVLAVAKSSLLCEFTADERLVYQMNIFSQVECQ